MTYPGDSESAAHSRPKMTRNTTPMIAALSRKNPHDSHPLSWMGSPFKSNRMGGF